MHIGYITPHRLPTEKAHGHQIAAVTSAMHALGYKVDVVAAYRNNPITATFAQHYDVSPEITVSYAGKKDYIASPWHPGALGFFCTNACV